MPVIEFLLAAMFLLCSAPVAFLFTPGMAACGGCNCASCTICSDDFNRADDTNINTGSSCGWTESSGSWAISSNTLQCTSAGIAICDTVHPDGDITMVAEVDFQHSNSGSTCDVIVGLVDSTHYFYARYTVAGGSGTIGIRRNNGGSHTAVSNPTTVTVTMNTATTYHAKVCVTSNGTITAYLDGTAKSSTFSQPVTGTQAGLGASGSGTASYDNWSFAKGHSPDAADCENCGATNYCADCGDITTYEMEVLLSGVAAGTYGSYCDCNNTTFIIPFNTTFGTPPYDCQWLLTQVGGCPYKLFVDVIYLSGVAQISVVIWSDIFGADFRFLLNRPSGPAFTCDEIQNLIIPPDPVYPGVGCDGSSALCLVSLV